jgi:acyl-CoA-binding protein
VVDLLQLYVGGLDPSVSEDELRKAFAKYEVASVKIPVGKQCGFVQFVSRYAPEAFTCLAAYFLYNLLEVIVNPCNCSQK